MFDKLPAEIVTKILKHVASSDVRSLFTLQRCSRVLCNMGNEEEVLREVCEENLHGNVNYNGRLPDFEVWQGYDKFFRRLLSASNTSAILYDAVGLYFRVGTDDALKQCASIIEFGARKGHFDSMLTLGVLTVSKLGHDAVVGVEMLKRCIEVGNPHLWEAGRIKIQRIMRNAWTTIPDLNQSQRLCRENGPDHVPNCFQIRNEDLGSIVCQLCSIDVLVYNCLQHLYH